jgi:hypothetical protein
MGQCKFECKDSKRDYAKQKLKKTWDRVSLKKETLKNRKEDFQSKVLKKDFRSKALKNTYREKKQSKEKRSKKATRLLFVSIQAPNTPDPNFLSVCLSFVLSASPIASS